MNKQSNATTDPDITVFYDGACPLCSREIAHYRRLERRPIVKWLDISQREHSLERFGLDYDTAMRRLHVLDGRTGMHSGVGGFMIMWDQLPYYRLLSRFIRLFRIKRPLEWLYVQFARWRYARLSDRKCYNGQCDPGAQQSRQEKGK